jgi:cytochrome c2
MKSGMAVVLGASGLVFAALAGGAAGAELDAGALFTTKCTSCHTFGHGDKVGPDLKGATQRHSRGWLVGWIQSSERMIREGDAAAVALFQQFRQQRMPDHELSTAQVEELIDYLAADGPAAAERKRVRLASSASPEEVKRGERLFFGKMRLASGGAACASCHALAQHQTFGASLAPDLSKVYAKYQDMGLSHALERPCFPRTPSASGAKVVTDDESLALRAFLRATQQPTAKLAAASQGGVDPSGARTGR